MKILKYTFLVFVVCIIIVPLLFINTKHNVVSEIDNRELTEFPSLENYGKIGSLSDTMEDYFSDRIGFRDDFLYANMLANDWLFHHLEHPLYMYGKDDYVFSKYRGNVKFGNFHITFINHIKKIENYCRDRGIDFIFVLNPTKYTIVKDKLPEGMNYDDSWLIDFTDYLDELDINYVNNIPLLLEKHKNGEVVYNKMYDATHWNELGAFYGVNNIIRGIKEIYPSVEENKKENFTFETEMETTLPSSKFPICDEVPKINPKTKKLVSKGDFSGEIDMDENFRSFYYYSNAYKQNPEIPKVLIFQGSYMNTRGSKFLMNAVREYTSIHCYQNVINADYYINIFKPDLVIFEVGQNVILDSYFSGEKMEQKNFNKKFEKEKLQKLEDYDDIRLNHREMVTEIFIDNLPHDADDVYLEIGADVYDAILTDGVYKVVVDNNSLNANDKFTVYYRRNSN